VPLYPGNRRLRGSKQKNACQADPLERLAHYARLKGADVRFDIRQFRHAH
jgi:hypothetical protein